MTDRYTPTWIAPKLAVGHAPMSYDDLAALKEQGIDAILNLCGEYCDLHDIENDYGFEVYYLPIPDESIPDTRALDEALEWLDEAIYLGKNVLVHCRFGVGRTGTLVTAYLIRRGLGLKKAAKVLKQTRANPSTYHQHKLLKKISRREKPLTIREPSLEDRHVVDLGQYFQQYEILVEEVEEALKSDPGDASPQQRCGDNSTACCSKEVNLTLIEAIYLNYRMNRHLKGEERRMAIQNALALAKTNDHATHSGDVQPHSSPQQPGKDNSRICPLNGEEKCLIFDYRPLSCRVHGMEHFLKDEQDPKPALQRLSNEVFFVYSGFLMQGPALQFSLPDTVSGRFVQSYFHYLAAHPPQSE